MTVITRMQQKRGTAAQWVTNDPVLAPGEIGYETDTNKMKLGDGTSLYSALPYFGGTGGGGIDIEDEGVPEATGATTLNFTGAGVTATDMGGGVVDIDIPGGSGTGGTATINITGRPGGYFDHVETVAAPGLVVGNRIHLQLEFEDNAEENGPEMLDVVSLSAECSADNTLTVLATFSTPTRGPINLIYGVI